MDRELYGASGCPYTRELRDQLECEGKVFIEFDVDADIEARRRVIALTGGGRVVPVLVEAGRVVAIGWHGRGCMIGMVTPGEA